MKPTTCYLDMDGVIADWIQAIATAHKLPYPYDAERTDIIGQRLLGEHWGMTRQEFWEPCKTPQFWRDIPKMPDADEILAVIHLYFAPDDVVILSTPNYEPAAMDGKIRWLNRHYRHSMPNYFFGRNKGRLAHPQAVLIDDDPKNVLKFSEAPRNGQSILVPRPWNPLHHIDVSAAQFIKLNLELMFNDRYDDTFLLEGKKEDTQARQD